MLWSELLWYLTCGGGARGGPVEVTQGGAAVTRLGRLEKVVTLGLLLGPTPPSSGLLSYTSQSISLSSEQSRTHCGSSTPFFLAILQPFSAGQSIWRGGVRCEVSSLPPGCPHARCRSRCPAWSHRSSTWGVIV